MAQQTAWVGESNRSFAAAHHHVRNLFTRPHPSPSES